MDDAEGRDNLGVLAVVLTCITIVRSKIRMNEVGTVMGDAEGRDSLGVLAVVLTCITIVRSKIRMNEVGTVMGDAEGRDNLGVLAVVLTCITIVRSKIRMNEAGTVMGDAEGRDNLGVLAVVLTCITIVRSKIRMNEVGTVMGDAEGRDNLGVLAVVLTCITIVRSKIRMNEARKARDTSLVDTKSLLSESHCTKSVTMPVATTAVAMNSTIQNIQIRCQPARHHRRSPALHCGYSLSCRHGQSEINGRTDRQRTDRYCSSTGRQTDGQKIDRQTEDG